MEDKVLHKLSAMTEEMYSSIMGQVKNGYHASWTPKYRGLLAIMEQLVASYAECVRGEVLEEQYQELTQILEQAKELSHSVFEEGDFQSLEQVKERLPKILTDAIADMEQGLQKYEQVAADLSKVDEYEKEFVSASSHLVADYKEKLRNRIRQNVTKVSQFETLSEEERRYFMTHVLFFDEGKLENKILEYLNEAENKVQQEVVQVECRAIIAKHEVTKEVRDAYVYKWRKEEGRTSPKELGISHKLLHQGEIEDKFETWFNHSLGEDSSVGKLINEGNKSVEAPMEEQMFQAMENVIDSNLGDLKMTEMLDAYKMECIRLKEKSFEEFYGVYDEITKLIEVAKKALEQLPELEVRDVSIADIILDEY